MTATPGPPSVSPGSRAGCRRRAHARRRRQGVRRLPALGGRARDRRAAAGKEGRAALRARREPAPRARPLCLRPAPRPVHRRRRRPSQGRRRADRVRRIGAADHRRPPAVPRVVKAAVKRTHDDLEAKAAAAAKEKTTARAGQQSSDLGTVAKRERDAQLRELTDQAHGANLDLGHALIHNLTSVDPTDIDVARFFVLCGCPHRTNYAERVTMPTQSSGGSRGTGVGGLPERASGRGVGIVIRGCRGRRARRRWACINGAAGISPASRAGHCSYSSNPAARRPSARGARGLLHSSRSSGLDLRFRSSSEPGVSRSARSRRERRRAERPARGRAGGALRRARSPSRAARRAGASSTSARSARSAASP